MNWSIREENTQLFSPIIFRNIQAERKRTTQTAAGVSFVLQRLACFLELMMLTCSLGASSSVLS